MNKVRPGEPVRGRLEARTHNTLLDVAEDYRRNRGKFFDPKAIGGDGVLPALTLSAYRDTGDGDLGEQCPCVLRFTDGADPGLQDPTQNVLGYMRRPTVYALSPTTGDEAEAIGITARAIPEGQFGPVYVQGVVLCTVNVSSTGHEYATLTNNATYLASATSGPAKILWKETASTGSQTCLVLLNGGLSEVGSATCIDIVHVTATSVGPLYTVKRVDRNGGTLAESSPAVTYTNVYEAQGRAAVVDPTSTPTHELPLYVDSAGKYFIQIDQYATPAYPGFVSTTTQTFGGDKVFEQSVEVFSQTGAGTSATRSFIAHADSKAAYSKSFQVSDGVTALSTLSDFGLNFYGVAVGQPAIASFTNGFDSVIDGSLVVGNNFVTTANHYSGGSSWAIQIAGGSTAPNGKDPTSIPTASGGFQLNIPGGGGGANVSPLRAFLFHEYDSVNSTRYSGLAIGSGGADCCIWIYSGGVYKRGYTGLVTFGGGASGDVASLDIFGGVVCGVTLVP